MPEFLSRPLEWFRARPRTQQALIGAGVLIVLVAASQVVSALAGLFFIAAVAAFLVQLVRRRSARPWAIAAGGALVAAIVFGGLASAIYGPVEDQAEVDRAEEQVVEEEPEQPRDQEEEAQQEEAQQEEAQQEEAQQEEAQQEEAQREVEREAACEAELEAEREAQREAEREAQPEPITLSGTGPQATDLFDLETGLTIVDMTHQGESNFIVDLLDEQGASVNLMGLVNEIGPFEGSTAEVIPDDGIYLIQVQADGPWSIEIE